MALVAFTGMDAVAAAPDSELRVKAVEGLWAYTSLKPANSAPLPLSGVILFKDGIFAQQSVYDGQPFEKQGAMALVAEQTISISPGKNPPLSFRRATQHDISVQRSGDVMTAVFDSGTVQTFKRIGPGAGEIYALEHGLLAFVDSHFVLVDGDESGVVSGYGAFMHTGTAYDLQVIRWAESSSAKTLNRRDVTLKATFDGKVLTLADGRSFRVVPRKK